MKCYGHCFGSICAKLFMPGLLFIVKEMTSMYMRWLQLDNMIATKSGRKHWLHRVSSSLRNLKSYLKIIPVMWLRRLLVFLYCCGVSGHWTRSSKGYNKCHLHGRLHTSEKLKSKLYLLKYNTGKNRGIRLCKGVLNLVVHIHFEFKYRKYLRVVSNDLWKNHKPHGGRNNSETCLE